MIPKKIHYCWFGRNSMPKMAVSCIESWKKFCPDYEIIQWNEDNYDIEDACDYIKEAYAAKKWAFVSDYARLEIIYKHGGIYLDTDVEVIKSLDNIIDNTCYLGTETTGFIATGLGFGAEQGSIIVREMLDEYSGKHFEIAKGVYDKTPCPARNTFPLLRRGFCYSEDNIWYDNNVVVYPPEYFCPINFETKKMHLTNKTISIHHYSALWIPEDEKKMEKEIVEMEKNTNPFFAFMKRQYIRYKFYRKKGEVNSIIDFLSKKIITKIHKNKK